MSQILHWTYWYLKKHLLTEIQIELGDTFLFAKSGNTSSGSSPKYFFRNVKSYILNSTENITFFILHIFSSKF